MQIISIGIGLCKPTYYCHNINHLLPYSILGFSGTALLIISFCNIAMAKIHHIIKRIISHPMKCNYIH